MAHKIPEQHQIKTHFHDFQNKISSTETHGSVTIERKSVRKERVYVIVKEKVT